MRNIDIQIIKTTYGINDNDNIRKFFFTLSNKEKRDFFREYGYFKMDYNIDNDVLFRCLLNKYIKIKLYGVVYSTLGDDFKTFQKMKKLELDFYKATGQDIHNVIMEKQ